MKTFLKNFKYIIFDSNHTESHNKFNSELINVLGSLGNVSLFSWNSSYNDLVSQSISIQKKKYLKLKIKNALFARLVIFLNTILNVIYLRSEFKKNKTIPILIGYEIISFSICSFLFPKGTYVIHHMQVDELNSFIKRFLFSFFKNRIVHVVMTDYIKDYLITNFNLSKDIVKVVPHPLYDFNSVPIMPQAKIFISLNYSTDETFIKKIIGLEDKDNYFTKNKCKLIIKSKLYNYNSEGLYVFKDFLESAEYYKLYENCTCVVSLLNNSFEYRISGTLIDAISARKPLMSLKSICASHYQKYFGESIMIYDNFNELIEEIANFSQSNISNPYSEELIANYRTNYVNNVQDVFFNSIQNK